jgi:hypothetical protein
MHWIVSAQPLEHRPPAILAIKEGIADIDLPERRPDGRNVPIHGAIPPPGERLNSAVPKVKRFPADPIR